MSEMNYYDCAPVVKAWRHRHLLAVPVGAVYSYAYERVLLPRVEWHSWRTHWSLSCGIASGRMNRGRLLDPKWLAVDDE